MTAHRVRKRLAQTKTKRPEAAVSTSIVGEKLGEALTDIGGEVLGSFGPAVNAWFPLERILELGELVDLTFASPVLDVVW